MPDNIVLWVVGGGLSALGFVVVLDRGVGACVSFVARVRRGKRDLVEHAIQEREHDDAVAWLKDTQPALAKLLEDVSAQGARIEARVGPNGGGSLWDSMGRMESTLAGVQQSVARIEHAQESHDELHDQMQKEREHDARTAFNVLVELGQRRAGAPEGGEA